jgi:hypothetical protein
MRHNDLASDGLSAIYQHYLTREDVEARIAFYNSKAGQDLLDTEPRIAGEAMPMMQQRAQEKGDVLTEELKTRLAEIKQPKPSAAQAVKP